MTLARRQRFSRRKSASLSCHARLWHVAVLAICARGTAVANGRRAVRHSTLPTRHSHVLRPVHVRCWRSCAEPEGGGAQQQPGQRRHRRLQARAGAARGPRQRSDRARTGAAAARGAIERRRRRRAHAGHGHRLSRRATCSRPAIPTDFALEDRPTRSSWSSAATRQLLTRAGNFQLDERGAAAHRQRRPGAGHRRRPDSARSDAALPRRSRRRHRAGRRAARAGPGPARATCTTCTRSARTIFRQSARPGRVPAEDRRVRSGFLELSGVNPVEEMVELIAASRAYEANVRLIQQHDQATSRTDQPDAAACNRARPAPCHARRLATASMSVQTLYTAATGMESLQSKLDVIANNLANVNTTGFKSDRANFEDLFYRHEIFPGQQDPASNFTADRHADRPGRADAEHADAISSRGRFRKRASRSTWRSRGKGFFQVTDPVTGQTALHAGRQLLDQRQRAAGRRLGPDRPAGRSADSRSPRRHRHLDLVRRPGARISSPGNPQLQQAGQLQLAMFSEPRRAAEARRKPVRRDRSPRARRSQNNPGHARHRRAAAGLSGSCRTSSRSAS